MTPVEALRSALKKEEASMELYRRLSVEHPAVKELLLYLTDEEYKHMIEKKIAEITKY